MVDGEESEASMNTDDMLEGTGHRCGGGHRAAAGSAGAAAVWQQGVAGEALLWQQA